MRQNWIHSKLKDGPDDEWLMSCPVPCLWIESADTGTENYMNHENEFTNNEQLTKRRTPKGEFKY
jgi:hypothetical protein